MEKISFKQCFKETMAFPQAKRNFWAAVASLTVTLVSTFFIDIYAFRMIQMIAGVASVAATQGFLKIFSVVVNTMDDEGDSE